MKSHEITYEITYEITWDHMRISDWDGVRQYEKYIFKKLLYPIIDKYQ
jgi:hypothetical protein